MSLRTRGLLFPSVFLTVALAACAPEPPPADDIPTFEEFRASLPYDRELDVHIVERDIQMNERQLRDYYGAKVQQMVAAQSREAGGDGPVVQSSQPLIVRHVNGSDVRWSSDVQRNLRYCVKPGDFGANYQAVVDAMNAAAASWEFHANVDFIHVRDLDRDTSCAANFDSNVVFKVNRGILQPGEHPDTLATAPFPDSGSRKVLRIMDRGLNSGFLETILIHELGHILGFEHETTRQILTLRNGNTCGWETPNWRALTIHDSNSIMNCTLTAASRRTHIDGAGAACVYGRPGGGSCEGASVVRQGVEYRSHVQDFGWLGRVRNGDISGTLGQSRRLEAFRLHPHRLKAGLCYSAHVAGIGWQPEVCTSGFEGPVRGTVGEGRAIEAIRVRSLDPNCTVHYQVHAAERGWLTPVSNNADGGTTGEGRRLEAMRVWVDHACIDPFTI